jgi:hypothetical protein
MNPGTDILDVLGGNKAAQIEVRLDADDVIKLIIGVAGGVLIGLLLFEGVKLLFK